MWSLLTIFFFLLNAYNKYYICLCIIKPRYTGIVPVNIHMHIYRYIIASISNNKKQHIHTSSVLVSVTVYVCIRHFFTIHWTHMNTNSFHFIFFFLPSCLLHNGPVYIVVNCIYAVWQRYLLWLPFKHRQIEHEKKELSKKKKRITETIRSGYENF